MTKTPQQIRNEVEKEILERWSLISTPDETLNKSKVNDLLKNAVRNTINQILTEYDKSIKEMIEDLSNIEFMGVSGNQARKLIQEELLSKIGDNSEVEK